MLSQLNRRSQHSDGNPYSSTIDVLQEHDNHLSENAMLNLSNELPRTALAMIEIDECEIHPINIFLGKRIGQGFCGSVFKSLVKASALSKLKDTISDSLKHEKVFAAVKILKGRL